MRIGTKFFTVVAVVLLVTPILRAADASWPAKLGSLQIQLCLCGHKITMATAIANTEARNELAASRARIVAAINEERRRVVRDLHDGSKQRLVHTEAGASRLAGDR